jgi:glycerol-3-phosphate O-acyltransferase/dihydroxyacetone phosphate acyltransferase
MVLKAFLDLVYLLLKQLVLLYQRIYYPFTVVRQRQRLNLPGGGIIISNHPNTMTDPLHIVSRSRRQVFFLANASLFKHPIANFLLNHLYCIPVSRPGRDTKGPPISLEESFARSFDHLAGGNVLYIAPEGTSFLERRLRPFKTGTARIALGAEAAHDFQLGLTIVPAGLNYEHPKDCGSRLFIDVGEPIHVRDWQAAYAEDKVAAVNDLTAHLEAANRALILHTTDDEQDQLLYRLERIWQNDQPLPVEKHYSRTRQLLRGLQQLQATQPETYTRLRQQAAYYAGALRQHQLTDRGLANATKRLWTPAAVLGFSVLAIWPPQSPLHLRFAPLARAATGSLRRLCGDGQDYCRHHPHPLLLRLAVPIDQQLATSTLATPLPVEPTPECLLRLAI